MQQNNLPRTCRFLHMQVHSHKYNKLCVPEHLVTYKHAMKHTFAAVAKFAPYEMEQTQSTAVMNDIEIAQKETT